MSSNDGLYTDSTLALRPDTGELAWHYQHHRRDVWDLDWAFEQSLVTLPVDGKPRKLVVTGGKTAIFDAVDARHRPIRVLPRTWACRTWCSASIRRPARRR